MARQTGHNPTRQGLFRWFLKAYMQVYHRLDVKLPPTLPERPPHLALTSHFSFLDVVALIVADPYHPLTSFVVKESVMRVPLVRQVLQAWGAVAVARDGRDLGALRAIRSIILRQGRGMCIAAQGTRSRTGRLGSMDPVLMRLALDVASKGVPIIPIVEVGTYEAMPAGSWFPRPHRIAVIAGDPVDLSPWCGRHVSDGDLAEVAALIQARLAALLPPERRPAPGTPALGGYRLERGSPGH